MELKERLRRSLSYSRKFTAKILSELETPADWLRRPLPGTNHAMWIAGHLALADNFFAGLIDLDKQITMENYSPLFGKGTAPLDDVDSYPPINEVLAKMEDRRSAILNLLEACKEDDFRRSTPDQAPPFMFDVGAVFQMAAWHESLHTGQLTIIHRSLGKTPLADRS